MVYKKHTSILPKPGYPPKVMQYQVDSFEIIYIQAKLNGLSRLYLCMQYKNNNNKKDAMNSRSRKGYIYIYIMTVYTHGRLKRRKTRGKIIVIVLVGLFVCFVVAVYLMLGFHFVLIFVNLTESRVI